MFITVEGGEGVGKTSFIRGLSASLIGAGYSVSTTREPGGTPIADQLRTVFAQQGSGDEKMTKECEFLLISAGRSQHVKYNIKKSLESGTIVLCDRYYHSSLVYQGILGGVDLEMIHQVNRVCTQGLEPDVTFLLDCPVDIALGRVSGREKVGDEVEHYDKQSRDFHQQVRTAFLNLAKEYPYFHILDGQQSSEEMIQSGIEALRKKSLLK